MKALMIKILILPFILYSVSCITPQCSLLDIKSILEGCDRLIGLNITSVGGTIVNDHNCDVLLPKQVFMEEPLFQYSLADSVSNLFNTFFLLSSGRISITGLS